MARRSQSCKCICMCFTLNTQVDPLKSMELLTCLNLSMGISVGRMGALAYGVPILSRLNIILFSFFPRYMTEGKIYIWTK